jgi:mRNA interferase HigB
MWLGDKPDFPVGGISLQCPNCRTTPGRSSAFRTAQSSSTRPPPANACGADAPPPPGYARQSVSGRTILDATLRQFVETLKGSKDQKAVKSALDAWFHEVVQADWENPADVLKAYANASIVGADRVVFNIKGNSYRLVVAISYHHRIVFIKWIGTHADYDKIDVKTVRYGHKTD